MAWAVHYQGLRGFLGLTGYYRRFIKGYASIALPSTELLKKDGFHWDALASAAFQKLKSAITQTPVLELPDFAQPFILETGASGTVIGAILSQGKHLIAYFSKKLTPRMRKQSTYVRELYAIFEAIAEFRHVGHRFIKKALSYWAGHPNSWVAGLAHKFLGYDFSIEYKPDKENIHADALSRSFLMALSTPQNNFLQQIREAIIVDPRLQEIRQQSIQGALLTPTTKYSIIYYTGSPVWSFPRIPRWSN